MSYTPAPATIQPQVMTYGINHIGTPRRGDLPTSYIRIDKYLPNDHPDSPEYEQRIAASLDDYTPVYPHWEPGRYNGNCASCWLGVAHTTASHDQALGLRAG